MGERQSRVPPASPVPATTSLSGELARSLGRRLDQVDAELARRYPGGDLRQPVHTVYLPAPRFTADAARRHGDEALAALAAHAPDAAALAAALGLPDGLAEPVHQRVVAKLTRQPVEDLRIDFEDGYGTHPDADEDAAALAAAAEVARGLDAATLPPRIGLRIKPFEGPARARGIRTLDVFLTALLGASGGRLPAGFVVTFPKAMVPEQVTVLVEVLDALEQALGLDAGVLHCELQVETTQAILDQLGTVPLPQLVIAARGRCTALHFGTYDYTAACGLPPSEQHLAHPACDFARHVMQVATAGTGVLLSDGSSNLLPVGPPETVRRAWRRHYELVRRSLAHGFHQGWDLHPAQLVSRYAAVFACYRERLPEVTARLAAVVADGPATEVADEPATARMLAAWLARGLDCGAIDQDETGVGRPLLERLTRPAAGAPPAPPSPR
jgi:hypothetical protein